MGRPSAVDPVPLRFAVVGLGHAARTLHVPAIRSLSGAALVGGVDVDPAARGAWARVTGSPAFEDLDLLVERGRPDVIVVGTPPDAHAACCIRALEAGADVICEKPFVTSLSEADAVLQAAARSGRRVALNMEFREMPVFAALRAAVGRRDVGRLVFVQMWQLMDLAPWKERVPWRAAMPERTLFEGGVHMVDILLALFGEAPDAVYARTSSGLREPAPETGEPPRADAIHLVTFEFPHGRLAQLTIDRLCRSGTRYVELRADCERASLRASLGGRALLQLGLKRAERAGLRLELGLGGLAWIERGATRRALARNPRNPTVAATAASFRKIARAFSEDGDPPVPGDAARETLRVVLACYESARSGRRVQLEPAASATGAP